MKIPILNALYADQSEWFKTLRTRLMRMASLHNASRVLEIGSGTSVMTAELAEKTSGLIVSSDPCAEALSWEAREGSGASSHRILADGRCMPLKSGSFDVCVCQMLLLWVPDPETVVAEAHGVLKGGGFMIVCAEPDYGGTLEYPESASIMGMIAGLLYKQGADPMVGRKLAGLFPPGKWDIVDFQIHALDPRRPDPDGDWVQRRIFSVRQQLSGHAEEKVLGRWESELRKSVARGSYFCHVPHFGLLARKKH
ncbi:MAG: methyltransferase domain-containing protein [Pseudomonadota bacterium]